MKVCAGDALADQVDVLWVASTGETLCRPCIPQLCLNILDNLSPLTAIQTAWDWYFVAPPTVNKARTTLFFSSCRTMWATGRDVRLFLGLLVCLLCKAWAQEGRPGSVWSAS